MSWNHHHLLCGRPEMLHANNIGDRCIQQFDKVLRSLVMPTLCDDTKLETMRDCIPGGADRRSNECRPLLQDPSRNRSRRSVETMRDCIPGGADRRSNECRPLLQDPSRNRSRRNCIRSLPLFCRSPSCRSHLSASLGESFASRHCRRRTRWRTVSPSEGRQSATSYWRRSCSSRSHRQQCLPDDIRSPSLCLSPRGMQRLPRCKHQHRRKLYNCVCKRNYKRKLTLPSEDNNLIRKNFLHRMLFRDIY